MGFSMWLRFAVTREERNHMADRNNNFVSQYVPDLKSDWPRSIPLIDLTDSDSDMDIPIDDYDQFPRQMTPPPTLDEYRFSDGPCLTPKGRRCPAQEKIHSALQSLAIVRDDVNEHIAGVDEPPVKLQQRLAHLHHINQQTNTLIAELYRLQESSRRRRVKQARKRQLDPLLNLQEQCNTLQCKRPRLQSGFLTDV